MHVNHCHWRFASVGLLLLLYCFCLLFSSSFFTSLSVHIDIRSVPKLFCAPLKAPTLWSTAGKWMFQFQPCRYAVYIYCFDLKTINTNIHHTICCYERSKKKATCSRACVYVGFAMHFIQYKARFNFNFKTIEWHMVLCYIFNNSSKCSYLVRFYLQWFNWLFLNFSIFTKFILPFFSIHGVSFFSSCHQQYDFKYIHTYIKRLHFNKKNIWIVFKLHKHRN